MRCIVIMLWLLTRCCRRIFPGTPRHAINVMHVLRLASNGPLLHTMTTIEAFICHHEYGSTSPQLITILTLVTSLGRSTGSLTIPKERKTSIQQQQPPIYLDFYKQGVPFLTSHHENTRRKHQHGPISEADARALHDSMQCANLDHPRGTF